ncbi:MAG: hypothetical protein A2Y12_07085 [Planctomycetes bacterium GWF2_42_9]|nr:MAG: hypothetical protein A2Y12_07085 [Planctomycetes bacterium GWF2_42_9]
MANGELPENERRHNTGDVLVMRAREDGNSFILLYDIFYEKIFRYCFINLRVKQVAEDITSIVFIRAAENARQFKGKTRRLFVEWVCGIAEAQLKIYLRKTNLENRDNEQIEIDPTHKERLRAKVAVAYEQGQMKKNKMLIYLVASVLIFITLLILINISLKEQSAISTDKPKLKPITEELKPAKIIERKAVMIQEQPEPEEAEIEEEKEAEPNLALKSEPNLAEPNQNQIIAVEKYQAVDGIRVEGKVVDWQQHPVQAIVTKGAYPKEKADRAECDAEGNFAFDAVETGVGVFTAQCEGAAPTILPVEITDDMPPVLIVLEQPNIIAGQIIDLQGVPIEGLTIYATGWRGINSLVFATTTDSQGYFQWNSAPADEVLLTLRKSGFMSTYNYPMQTGVDYKITMLPPIKMHGSLISAEPTMQIESFIMTVGYYFEAEKISWLDANSVIFSGINYEINITEPYDFKLKVQAEGFKTAESPVFNTSKTSFDFDFVMRKE